MRLSTRARLEYKMNDNDCFTIKDFRHPVSRKHYFVEYANGYMTVIRNAGSKERKTLTCDSFLYFWLEDDNIPSQDFKLS